MNTYLWFSSRRDHQPSWKSPEKAPFRLLHDCLPAWLTLAPKFVMTCCDSHQHTLTQYFVLKCNKSGDAEGRGVLSVHHEPSRSKYQRDQRYLAISGVHISSLMQNAQHNGAHDRAHEYRHRLMLLHVTCVCSISTMIYALESIAVTLMSLILGSWLPDREGWLFTKTTLPNYRWSALTRQLIFGYQINIPSFRNQWQSHIYI